MPYVYSTCTCDGTYVEYEPDPEKNKGFSKAIRQVTIKGGHGVNTRHLHTPKGIVTQVTDDELEFLLRNASFQRHMAAGHITVDKDAVDPAKKAAEMAEGDNSAPLTPKDFKNFGEGEGSTAEARIIKGNYVKRKAERE